MSSSNSDGLTLRAALAQERYRRQRMQRAVFAYDEWRRGHPVSISLDDDEDERRENDDGSTATRPFRGDHVAR